MSVLIGVEDVLKTFSLEEQESARQYFAYEKLREQYPDLGYKRLAKALGVKIARTRWWKQKKGKPCAIKITVELTALGLLPFDSCDPRLDCVLRLLGTLYGDGGIDASLNNIFFSSGDLYDIELWKNDLLSVFPRAGENLELFETGEFGHGNCLRCTTRTAIRFFVAIGAPRGDKILNHYSLPPWLSSSGRKQKIAFLDGFLACEVSVPTFRVECGTKRFKNFSFSLSKQLSMREEHRAFLKSLADLLESVGVKTTGLIRDDVHLDGVRKSGVKTRSFRVFISTYLENILAFNELFDLRYASKKKAGVVNQLNRRNDILTAVSPATA